jgi:hypothetical protein
MTLALRLKVKEKRASFDLKRSVPKTDRAANRNSKLKRRGKPYSRLPVNGKGPSLPGAGARLRDPQGRFC